MLNDLDKTLQKLLASEISTLAAERIYFDTPDDKFAPATPAIDLFLYDVRENLELRSNEWMVDRHSKSATKTPPFARVECSYLVTAWAGDIASEHALLGSVIRALLRHPFISADLLQGSLTSQPLPLPTTSLQPGKLQSPADFWQALGGKPRAALYFTVTIAVGALDSVEEAVAVEKIINLGQL